MKKITKSLVVPKIVISIIFMTIISGCHNFNDWMEKSDSEFAEKYTHQKAKMFAPCPNKILGPGLNVQFRKQLKFVVSIATS